MTALSQRSFLSRARGDRGFTLIEMLAVATIVGLVAAAAAPLAKQAVERSTLDNAYRQAAEIQSAFDEYQSDRSKKKKEGDGMYPEPASPGAGRSLGYSPNKTFVYDDDEGNLSWSWFLEKMASPGNNYLRLNEDETQVNFELVAYVVEWHSSNPNNASNYVEWYNLLIRPRREGLRDQVFWISPNRISVTEAAMATGAAIVSVPAPGAAADQGQGKVWLLTAYTASP